MVVVEAEGSVVARAASHDEVAESLAAYAAGTLEPERLRAVQVHLASGCESCLGALFEAPVGKPRPPEATAAAPSRTSGWNVVAILALVAAVAVSAGLVVRERRRHVTSVGEILARVVDSRSGRGTGALTVTNRVTNTADARRAIRVWAQALRTGLDSLHKGES